MITIFFAGLPVLALASAAEVLAQAKNEISANHMYSADALFQEVIDSEDAAANEVQEALLFQSLIYSGDVLGAAAMVQPLMGAGSDGNELKGTVSQQLLLARRAFAVSLNSYLNATVLGSELEKIQVELPELANDDVEKMLATLADPRVLGSIVEGYPRDPSVGQGLIARINQYSMYLAISAVVPEQLDGDLGAIRRRFQAGVAFNQAHYLDWAAKVAIDMNRMVNEPGGPNLLDLARRCDERLVRLESANPASIYLKNARERAEKF